MKLKHIQKNKQSGVTILLAILILSAVIAISFSLTTILFIEIRSSADLLKTEGPLYGATGVGEQALFNLKRQACPGNSSSCYYSQFSNRVTLTGNPSLVSSSPAIFTSKALAGSTFASTASRYSFCGTNQAYDQGDGHLLGCGYGKVTLNYISTNAYSDQLKGYLCEWDQNGSYPNSVPCSEVNFTSPNYWLAPCSTGCGSNIQGSDGSVLLTPVINTTSWNVDPNKQQELIIVNNNSNDIYFSLTTYDTDKVTPKGLPYVGQTAVDVGAVNGAVGRKIRVVVPNSATSAFGSASGFSYFRSITVNGGQVNGGPLSNFPVLVNWTDNTLRSSANGGNVQDSAGKDIVFTSDAAGSAIIPFELEKYASTTGNVVAWVKNSNLADGSVFYMFYGKASAADQSNKNSVWNANYKAVWHFGNASSLDLTDSTASPVNGSPGGNGNGSAAAGKISGALRFTDASIVDFGTNSKLYNALNSSFTLDMWLNIGSGNQVIFGRPGSTHARQLGYNAWSPNSMSPQEENSGIFTNTLYNSYLNSWHKFTWVYDGSSNTSTTYIDGVQQVSGSYTFNLAYSGAYQISEAGRYLNGSIDELEISDTNRSGGWLLTEYNNQNSPSAFYTVGSQQIAP